MNVEFQKVSNFTRGIYVKLLKDAYSFDKSYEQRWYTNWKNNDDFFFDHLDIADQCSFITTVDDKPIGFVTWDPRNMPEYAELGDNCIITSYKGRGYGNLQLQEAINRIRKSAVKKIIVTTDENLIPARHNYESVGFQFVRTWKENDVVHMDYEMDVRRKYMNLRYDTEKNVPCEQLRSLFMSVGWSDGNETKEMLDYFNVPFINSTYVVTAWDDEKLVGCIRVLSDKIFRSIIYDLAVIPEYQGNGIGSELVKRCRDFCPNSEWLVQTIPSRVCFYENNGFTMNDDPFLSISSKWF